MQIMGNVRSLSDAERGECVALVDYYRNRKKKTVVEACQMVGYSDPMYYAWRTRHKREASQAALIIAKQVAEGIEPGPGPLLASPKQPEPVDEMTEEELEAATAPDLAPAQAPPTNGNGNGNGGHHYPISRHAEKKAPNMAEQALAAMEEEAREMQPSLSPEPVQHRVWTPADIPQRGRQPSEAEQALTAQRLESAVIRDLRGTLKTLQEAKGKLKDENKQLRTVLGDILVNSKLRQLAKGSAEN